MARTVPVVALDSMQRNRGVLSAVAAAAGGRRITLARADPRRLTLSPSRSWRAACVHYGVMIPDLPAPHRFLATMIVIGKSGTRAWDDDNAVVHTARDTVTVAHGTAAAGHDPFRIYSARDDCDLRDDGGHLRFGDELTLSGTFPNFRLRSRFDDLAVDLELTATGETLWFIDNPLYRHVALFAHYSGTITHAGQTTRVSGLCTYEYAVIRSPQMLRAQPLPPSRKIPLDFFTYHIIPVDEDTRLILVATGVAGRPGWLAAYWRSEAGGVCALGNQVTFEVLSTQPVPQVANATPAMTMPDTFRWTATDGKGNTAVEITGTVDTEWLYAGMGYIGGFRYHGHIAEHRVDGLAYLEYSDRRR
ncbi:DUF6670 family protein [Nocardia sp. NPDC023988]|uniref:DUF6670 family protein n=1 Tax=unclassified Nocardia TaxID=2637762 RepID=UPI0033F38F0A